MYWIFEFIISIIIIKSWPKICFAISKWRFTNSKSAPTWVQVDICTRFTEIPLQAFLRRHIQEILSSTMNRLDFVGQRSKVAPEVDRNGIWLKNSQNILFSPVVSPLVPVVRVGRLGSSIWKATSLSGAEVGEAVLLSVVVWALVQSAIRLRLHLLVAVPIRIISPAETWDITDVIQSTSIASTQGEPHHEISSQSTFVCCFFSTLKIV